MLHRIATYLISSLIALTAAAKQPNIVVILADDLGPGDIAFLRKNQTGIDPLVKTPIMDSLAQEGMRFTDAHSSTALCSPTRYCMMTGSQNYRSYAPWGVWGSFRQTAIKAEDATLGRVAQSAGLTTAFIGKWHLGGDFNKLAGEGFYRGNDRGDKPLNVDATALISGGPQSFGFDYSFTMPCGVQGPFYTAYENGTWYPFAKESKLIHLNDKTALEPQIVSDKGHGTGDSHWDTRQVGPLLSSKAVDFIKGSTSSNKPFLLYYCSPQVHIPHMPPAEFDGLKFAGQHVTPHLDMIVDLDQQMRRIVDALKESGVYDNTLIILTSDNGGLRDGKAAKAGHDSSNGYRGFKNEAYEGGHRVPFFAVWPAKIAPNTESDEPIVVHDVLATLAALLDQPLKDNQAMDSLNLLPLLLNDGTFKNREHLLLQGGSFLQSIYRHGDWKLIIQSERTATEFKPLALFNLYDNPLEDETKNFVNDPAHAERVKQMQATYITLRTSGVRTTPPLAEQHK